MAATDLVDHSPHQPDPRPPLSTAANLILIDNYDSFTWNVYQYLALEGAKVTVYRNDEISLDELISKNPTQLVVSPGPGHPTTDSGISRDAIKHFAGRIPILGVCMGEQCIYSVFGGDVEKTGEILHGKTSPLRHDGKGIYSGLAQDLPVTRYHSLAGTHPTLPECLEVSSWIATGPDGGRGVIMGVRHKEFVIEGVQYHPESILTAEGRDMFKNFLRMQGGTWKENERLSGLNPPSQNGAVKPDLASSTAPKESILEKIYRRRKELVTQQKEIPSQRPADLQAMYELDIAPTLVSFVDRVRDSPFSLSLLAEVKRASPSKGIISLTACAPAQARTYALAGASVISVLTEPDWFKGSLDDMRAARQAVAGMPNRPAILRKEFIFDEYQILEARLAGADTVLLIVKMLDLETLTRLYKYSQSLGMEPLVEVNTIEETEIAVKLGSKVIGVNNRNLTSFEVDMDTTTRLMKIVPKETTLLALSGISGPEDVRAYQKAGIGGVLVGEALMRAKDTASFISELLGGTTTPSLGKSKQDVLVKICGTRSAEAAKTAIDAGADLIGMILVPGRKRTVTRETALEISRTVRSTMRPSSAAESHEKKPSITGSSYFEHTAAHHMRNSKRALLVGVFQNQPLQEVLQQTHDLDLDIVQLHGSEPTEWASIIPVPVIKACKPGDSQIGARGQYALPLLDAGSGGSGQSLATDEVIGVLQKDQGLRVILAGGLTPDNLELMVTPLNQVKAQIAGVDVSSGVETDGKQDLDKIRNFVMTAKKLFA